ncbi:MAG: hypothetical protein IAE78_32360, partial [Myxococcus sp.]|nr:hypothetical protein [Myxococcus sp.]
QTLAQARASIVGRWQGSWTANYQQVPVGLTLSFEASGTYTARAATPGTLALGYGVDGDSPLKQYTLDNLKANGDATGFITIYWGNPSTTQGELDSVRFCDGGRRMDFVFYPAWLSRNPHWYRLTRM